MSNNEILLTNEDLEQLNKELRNLLDVERPQIREALNNAREMGDLSENADYQTAKDELAKIESRIEELQNIINKAKIIEKDTKKSKEVKLSSKVIFQDLADNVQVKVEISSTFSINDGASEYLKVSNLSPLGEALLGHKVGDEITVKVAKPYNVKIISIE